MKTESTPRSALIFGGTGAVGSELVRLLSARGCKTAFTYLSSVEKAKVLESEYSSLGLQVDLASPANVKGVFDRLDTNEFRPDILIYAAVHVCPKPLEQVSAEDWQRLEAINCHSAWVAVQEFVLRYKTESARSGQILFLSALDRTQSLPLPSAFAGTQGKQGAMAMALGKELGPKGICVNLVALGALENGQSGQGSQNSQSKMSSALDPKLVGEFKNFSALGRLGQPAEVARSIVWLALENTYMTGRVFAANGGI